MIFKRKEEDIIVFMDQNNFLFVLESLEFYNNNIFGIVVLEDFMSFTKEYLTHKLNKSLFIRKVKINDLSFNTFLEFDIVSQANNKFLFIGIISK